MATWLESKDAGQQNFSGTTAKTPKDSLVGHEVKLVTLPHNASLALAHGNRTHVLVFVNDRHPERGKWVPREGLCVVQDLKQGAPLVPGALFGVDRLHDVVTQEAGDGQEDQVLLWVVAAASQEGR